MGVLKSNRLLMTLAISGILCAPCVGQAASDAKPPNIVYFYADDLGYGQVGAYGQKKIRTPNIDKLAAEGIKFTRHYASAPLCSPSRASLLTGLHTGHSTIRFNYEFGGYTDDTERGQMPLPPHSITIGNILQDAGYVTGCVGKWGLGMADTSGHPNRQGFDYFFGYLDQKQPHTYYPTHLWENSTKVPLDNEYIDVHELQGKPDPDVDFARYQNGDHAYDHMSTRALSFIEKNKDRPFFLYFATPLPHNSQQPKPEYLEPYLKELTEDKPYLGEKRYAPHEHPRAAYAAMISMVDADLGRIMAKLQELGLDENTLVIFSSDNGPSSDIGGVDGKFFNSSGGLRGHKGSLYEGGIREPMIARWPGHIAPGTTTDLPSAQYDVMATFCDLTGVSGPELNDGISFLPTLLGKADAQKRHKYLYWEFPGKGGSQAVSKENWKIVRRKVNGDPNTAWELYDLKSDPLEKNNVAAEHPGLVKEMAGYAEEAHWTPVYREWEFIDPKRERNSDRMGGW